MNILVAEDNQDDVVLLTLALKRANLTSSLTAVGDGLEALAYLNGEPPYADRVVHPFPDILLLDLNMPRMNGFELLERVRADSSCARLMAHVLTSSSRPTDVQRAYELHANSYTVKPTRLEELVAFLVAIHQWHRFVTLAPPPAADKCACAANAQEPVHT